MTAVCEAQRRGYVPVRITRDVRGWPVGYHGWLDPQTSSQVWNADCTTYWLHPLNDACERITTTMDLSNLKPGDHVKLRNGTTEVIIDIIPDRTYSIRGTDNIWTPQGSFSNYGGEHELDIVEVLPTTLDVKVGDKVKLRNGTTETIINIIPDRTYPIRSQNGSWTAQGKFYDWGAADYLDIVEVLPTTTLASLDVKVGDKVKLRNGDIHTIVSIEDDLHYPLLSDNLNWTPLGQYLVGHENHHLDIVEVLPAPAERFPVGSVHTTRDGRKATIVSTNLSFSSDEMLVLITGPKGDDYVLLYKETGRGFRSPDREDPLDIIPPTVAIRVTIPAHRQAELEAFINALR